MVNKTSTEFLKETSFIELEEKAFQAIQRIFPCEGALLNQIPLERIIRHFQDDLSPAPLPFLIRVAGQSGSGKSSQIIPALEYALQGKKYIKINVGSFAPFHPQYDEWQTECPDQMRERTNGFALKALVLFYKHCILHRVNIVFDMTLLEPEIDLYLMILAKKMGYRIQAHVLCVPKKVSDLFIHLRQLKTGRYVRPSSSGYFFNALSPCLKALTRSHLFTADDTLILWSHYLMHPIKKTHLNNPMATRILENYRQADRRIKNPKTLLKAKKKLIKNLMEKYDV